LRRSDTVDAVDLREAPFSVVPPGLLLLGWVTLWMRNGRITWWFFAWGLGLVVLCFPAGLVGTLLEPPCYNPQHETFACGIMSTSMANAWTGGFLAFCCLAVLAPVTLLVNAFAREPDR
jgi:hypothetical protein